MSAHDQVREYITKLLRETAGDTDPVTDSDSLVASGRLSSVDVVDVLSFLERDFNFAIDPRRFDPARFDTINSIVAMLQEQPAKVK